MISIIIPSLKNEVLTKQSLSSCPVEHEVVVTGVAGLGFARNWGAFQANSDFYVFLDDDLVLNPQIWRHVLSTGKGEFAMTFLSGFPCSRVMAVHRYDFWRIRGFDDRIKFTGEDRDFYVRALDAGLKFKEIPLGLVEHKPHEYRYRNIHIAIGSTKENMQFLVKYWRRHPTVFRIDFLDRAKRGQARTLLLQVIFLFQAIVRRNKHG